MSDPHDRDDGGPGCELSLRDYFAGQAMLGCLSEYVLTGTTSGDSEAAFAAHCYRLADAMLAERVK